jgi:hypothetical protein
MSFIMEWTSKIVFWVNTAACTRVAVHRVPSAALKHRVINPMQSRGDGLRRAPGLDARSHETHDLIGQDFANDRMVNAVHLHCHPSDNADENVQHGSP